MRLTKKKLFYLFIFLFLGSTFLSINHAGAVSIDLSNNSFDNEVDVIPVATVITAEDIEEFFQKEIKLFNSDFSSFQEKYATDDKKQLDQDKVKLACENYLQEKSETSFEIPEDVNDARTVKFERSFFNLNTHYKEKISRNPSLADDKPASESEESNEKNSFLTFFNEINDCRSELLGEEFADILQYIFNAIKIVVPILMIILIMKDFITAIGAGKEEDMKKAQSDAIKRLIIGVIIFLLPTIVNVILGIIGIGAGTCGIG